MFQPYINFTLDQAYEKAIDCPDSNHLQSTSFMIATLSGEFQDRGYGRWVITAYEHQHDEPSIEMLILNPETMDELRIGMVSRLEDPKEENHYWMATAPNRNLGDKITMIV